MATENSVLGSYMFVSHRRLLNTFSSLGGGDGQKEKEDQQQW